MQHTFRLSCLLLAFLGSINLASSQEYLLPLSSAHRLPHKHPKQSDTLILTLPFFDDFSNYSGAPNPNRWLDDQAFVSADYAANPPSIGMVTLDALDASGNLYPHASSNIFGADTLTSHIVRLDSLLSPVRRRLTPADSIVLSFFYLPGGGFGNMWERIGDMPEQQDSLFLDFFSLSDSSWHTVWASPGFSADTAGINSHWPWRFAAISISDEQFLSSKFQFRFRNYASFETNPKLGIVANSDQWNIDYIHLDYNRSVFDSTVRDIAFVAPAPSMLDNFLAMPFRQFSASDMASALSLKMTNLYTQTLSAYYSYKVLDENNNPIANYDGGYENIRTFFPNASLQSMAVHASPSVQFSFPSMNRPTSFKIVHVVRDGVSGDKYPQNDTISFSQIFDNFYAYDDGTPENGYGITTAHGKIAYRFDLSVSDTLTAVDLYFNRTRNRENEEAYFLLSVWADNNGKPGNLLYQDVQKMKPEFEGLNKYHRYKLSSPVFVNGPIYVGFEQLSDTYINLGFDRSNDSHNKIFYQTDNTWRSSLLKGSLLLRPRFGSSALLSSYAPIQSPAFALYPNPASSYVSISFSSDDTSTTLIQIYSLSGHLLRSFPFTPSFSVSDLDKGVYLVQFLNTQNGSSSTAKLVVK